MASSNAMSQRERDDLRRLMKADFKRLRGQVAVREQELKDAIREQIIAESKANIAKGRRKLEAFRRKVDKLHEDAKVAWAELEELGVVPSQSYTNEEYDRKTDDYHTVTRHSTAPIYGVGDEYRRNGIIQNVGPLSVPSEVVPIDIDKQVDAAFKKIAKEAGFAKINLDRQEGELERELILGGLQSDEAQEFFNKIPKAEELVPIETAQIKGYLNS